MGVLTVVFVTLSFRQDLANGAETYALYGLSALFLAEFGARFWDAADRRSYLRTHWLDFVTAIPTPGVPGLRLLRLLRLRRLVRVGMLLRKALLRKGWKDTTLIWPTLVFFWVASSVALWLVEHDAPGANITSLSDAMTASFITASTLGFGSHEVPVTMEGEVIAALTVFFSLGLWGFASSRLTVVAARRRCRDAQRAGGASRTHDQAA